MADRYGRFKEVMGQELLDAFCERIGEEAELFYGQPSSTVDLEEEIERLETEIADNPCVVDWHAEIDEQLDNLRSLLRP
jgi:archaellum component FlaC